MYERVKVATRLSSKLSEYCLDDAEQIQWAFEELIGKPVGDTFTLIPPFYADHGLNIVEPYRRRSFITAAPITLEKMWRSGLPPRSSPE